ncbi:CubicO group peptidase, beta-lactamase class C family [Saccharopolyspora antimicrobica]|uniref:CubicO group peptidase (Beta-lactamase class C family) n=1 Tax=Saccharopolyspora antimicrobica TaxID=455193 RepID=A0A1I4YA47_9PSEU|nr:CubicO group peptidase (beta-lactamase class C family) [Saccharopolyspora antimicrobica]SFN34946.1 CubicO group peptidase, beta-lactamase class C family [Saccharopolyspora antimicrobica]
MWTLGVPAKTRRVIFRTLVAALALAAPLPPAPADIDATVQEYLRSTGLPGAAVTVTRGTEVLHAAGYGRTPDGEPITERTPMAVASVSKSFTALAVLQLAESGRLELDGPVRAHLPEFRLADPRADRITVRQLLDQTSGLSDSTVHPFTRPQPGSLAEAVASMRSATLVAEPGERWEYHNPNYQVAARLVEVVSGLPFDDYLQRHVFGPLGMADSRAIDTADELPPSARGHLLVLGGAIAVPEPPAFGGGSGGVLSTAHDMAAWLTAQNNPGRTPIASAAAITEAHTPSPASGSYALGWSVGTTDSGERMVSHSGDLFTSTAYQALLPDSGYGIAVMTNTGLAHGDATALADELIALMTGQPAQPPNSALPVIDAVLLGLAIGAALLAARGAVRARRWAASRTGRISTVLRLLPLLVPAVLCASINQIVGALYRGRDVALIQVPYLYPTFTVLLVTAALGGVVVLIARLTGLARAVST